MLRPIIPAIVLSTLLLLVSNSGYTQISFANYSFSQSSGSYSNITGGTVAASGTGLNSQTYKVALPFSFNINNVVYDTTYISVNGHLAFGSDPGSAYWAIANVSSGISVAAGFSANLASFNSTSEIRYKTVGTAPNRTFIVQWKNMGYPSSSQLKTTFQIHLEETTSEMMVVYDTVDFSGTSLSVQVGLRGTSTAQFFHRKGSWSGSSNASSRYDDITLTSSNKPSVGLTYKFTPPQCVAPVQPSNITFNATVTAVNVKFNKSSNASKYLYIRTPLDSTLTTMPVNGTFYSNGDTLGNGKIIRITSDTSYTDYSVSPNTLYRYTIIPYDDKCLIEPKYNTSSPLSDTVRTFGPKTYIWQPTSGTHDFQADTNWVPSRVYATSNDTLVFNKGGTVFIENFNGNTVDGFHILNNTHITLSGTSASSARSLTIRDSFYLHQNSSLTLGGSPVKIKFTGVKEHHPHLKGALKLRSTSSYEADHAVSVFEKALILEDSAQYVAAGGHTTFNDSLILTDTSLYESYTGITIHNASVNLADGSNYKLYNTSHVTFKDTVNVYGQNAQLSGSAIDSSLFAAGSVYMHMRDGGKFPGIDFDIASTFVVAGITNTAPEWLGYFNNNVGEFIWNCPNQAIDVDILPGLTSTKRNLHLVNTGGHKLKLNYRTTTVEGNFIQDSGTFYQLQQASASWTEPHSVTVKGNAILKSGAILDLNKLVNNRSGDDAHFQVQGNFIQSPGHSIVVTGDSFRTGNISFYSTKHQLVQAKGYIADTSHISYSLSNPEGATLTDTLTVHEATNSIFEGIWSGPGGFIYDSNSTLNYSFNNVKEPAYITAKEWPAANGPTHVSINMNNRAYPYNQVSMPGHRTVTGEFDIAKTILHLNDYNLTIDNDDEDVLELNTKTWQNMITASGDGYLIRKIAQGSADNTYYFPIGDNNGNLDVSGVILDVYDNDTVRYVGVRVRDVKHPNNTNTDSTATRYWTFTDSSNDTMSYRIKLNYPLTDDVPTLNKDLMLWNGSKWNKLDGYVSLDETFNNSGKYYYEAGHTTSTTSIKHPLNADITVGVVDAASVADTGQLYTWTGTVDNDYQKAGNWTPNRNTPQTGDSLRFNSGLVDSVHNIPTDTVRQIHFTNNTKAYFASTTNATAGDILYVYSDGNSSTHEIMIDSGSALYMTDVNTRLSLKMEGDSCTALIAGRIEMDGGVSNAQRYYSNCLGCQTTVTYSGVLTRHQGAYYYSRDTNSYIVYGTVENDYPWPEIGLNAAWKDSSTMIMTGIKYNSFSSSWQNANLYNLDINCPNMPVNCVWDNAILTIRNELKVTSTGSGDLGWRYDWHTKKYRQTGGTVYIANNRFTAELHISDSLIHTGGVLSTYSTNQSAQFTFDGDNARQYVTFHNAAPNNFSCDIYNPNGIKVVGTGSLTTNLNAYQIGVYADIDTPLLTPLNITYPTGSGKVTYSVNANYTLDTTYLLPAVNGPAHLTVTAGSDNIIKLYTPRHFNRLDVSKCVLDIGDMDLEVGTSTSTPGFVGGFYNGTINIDSGGSLKIWMGTGSNYYYPTSLNDYTDYYFGSFPLSYNGSERKVALYYTSSEPFSAGGTITVAPLPGTGQTNNLSVQDGSYTISSRTNTGWDISTGNGLALKTGRSIYMSLYADGPGIGMVDTVDSLRIMTPTTVVGDHVNGQNNLPPYIASRKNLTISDLNNTFYLGTSTANFHQPYISVKSGNWNKGDTWNKGTVPGSGDSVLISGNHNVVIDTSCFVGNLIIAANGILSVNDSTLRVDTTINSEGGTVKIQGGNIVLGPQGGGNGDIRFYGGALQIDSGRLEVNGSLRLFDGYNTYSQYIQTGGEVIIDGNAGGDTTLSVPSGRPLFYISGRSYDTDVSGGTITFVDPHAGTDPVTSNVMEFDDENRYLIGLDHIYFGDGISTDSGGHKYGFKLYSANDDMGDKNFPDVTIKGSASGKNRVLSHPGKGWNIRGDLNITGPGIVYDNTESSLMVEGDIYVGSGSVFKSRGNIFFTRTYELSYSSFGSSERPQRFYGPGTILNDTTYTMGTLYANNSSSAGVSIEIGDFSVYNLRLEHGFVRLHDTATLTVLNRIDPYPFPNSSFGDYDGWLAGTMRQRIVATSNFLFPLGDTNGNYTPIIMGMQVQSEGYIKASAKPGEHPNINSSKINSSKNVNVKYNIDTTDGLIASGIYFDLAWDTGSADAGAAWPQFITQAYQNNTWKDYSHTIVNDLTAHLDSFTSNDISGVYVLGEPGVSPVITQQPQSDTACSGGNTIISVTATAVDSMRWQLNTGSSWAPLYDNATYAGTNGANLYISGITTSMSNYKYRCILYNVYDTTISDAATLSVNTTVVPSIAIAATPGDTICAGTSVSFASAITNGGSTPAYSWRKNGVLVGQGASYNPTTLNDGDVIIATLESSSQCASPSTVSDTITMVVNPSTTPAITITSNMGDSICAGTSVTFTADTTNVGSSATVQWRLNGTNISNTTATYTTSTLSHNDKVSCVLNSNSTCATPSIVRDTIKMNVFNNDSLAVAIGFIFGDSSICYGQSIRFKAIGLSGNTSSVNYTWKRNGTTVSSISSYLPYPYTTIKNNDVITLTVSTNVPCFVPSTSSDTVNMKVYGNFTPNVAINVLPNDTVCAGTPVTFTTTKTNAGSTPKFEWRKNGVLQTDTTDTYSAGALSNNDVVTVKMTTSYICPTVSDVYDTASVTVRTVAAPTVSISKNTNDTICSGASVTFTATPVNGGGSPSYQWRKNGSNVGTNSTTYTTTTLSDKDTITCILTSSDSCAASLKDTSTGIVMYVLPIVTPTVSVSASPNSTTCSGTLMSFSASTTNGGNGPSYQWKVNSTSVGTNSNAYSSSSLSDKDTVKCILTSNVACPSTTTITDSIVVTITPMVTPDISISVSPNDTICAGTSVTFTAAGTNGGSSPAYQWFKNGVSVGSNSTYTSSSLSNNDTVYCVLTNSDSCVTKSTDTSNMIRMEVLPLVNSSVSISVSPNDTICAGTTVTFTSTITNGGTSPSYIWKRNATTVSTSSTYSTNSLNNGDSVACVLINNVTCPASTYDTSSYIHMTVNPLLTPAIVITASPSDTICPGSSITYTANITNGGTNPAYQWKVNGTNSGTSNTYSSSTWSNNDVVTCQLTSNAICPTTTTASDTSTVVVLPNVTPGITISISPDSVVCSGTPVSFSSNISNGGNNPAYQWRKNGAAISGANTNAYNGTGVNNNDVIDCILTSDEQCATPLKDTSNAIKVQFTPVTDPSVAISVVPGTTIPQGTSVTFTANPTNAGTSPTYQWYKNGTALSGEVNNTYVTSTLADNDKVHVLVTSSDSCSNPDTSSSNELTITVNNSVEGLRNVSEELQLFPNPNDGTFILKGRIAASVNQQQLTYRVVDIVGKVVSQGTIQTRNHTYSKKITLDEQVSDGIYFIRISIGGYIYTVKFSVIR